MIKSRAVDCLDKEYAISPYARYLKKHGFISAAIYYKNLNETKERRAARALRHAYETVKIPEYQKGSIVFINPSFDTKKVLRDNYVCDVDISGKCMVNREKFSQLPTENKYEEELKNIIIQNSENQSDLITDMRWHVHGMHHTVDFRYLLKNGINGYKKMIFEKIEEDISPDQIQFYESLLDVITGLEVFIEKHLAQLKAIPNPDEKLQRLIKTIEVVPMNPATNFYEAFIMCHSTLILSDCMEPGRLDSLLNPYYEADETATYEFAYECVRALLEDIDTRMGHPLTMHVTVGGSKPDGTHDYNTMTEICVKAIGGLRAPNMSLRVCEDMPQNLWDIFIDNISKGYAQPALVNEKQFIDGLVEQYNVPVEDAVDYVFGGCSELMIQGKTFVDAHWMAYNVLDVLEQTIYNNLLECETFDSFYNAFKTDIKLMVQNACYQVNIRQHACGENEPYPLRSLFTFPCVQNGVPFTKGGAQYNFDCSNIYGATNAINALYTIKKFYEHSLSITSKEDFLTALSKNYVGYENVLQEFIDVPKYGNFNKEINVLTNEVMGCVMDELKSHRCFRGEGYFMPAVVLFVYWEKYGRRIGATPDGRRAGDVLADSAGPSTGTDKEGPTATMGAVLSIPQEDCVGTCVLNIRLDKANFKSDNDRMKIQQLCNAYIMQGGNQLQVNVLDKEMLLDAMEHPENHEDIIVRVGGFSDNFVFLADPLKKDIIKRTEL